MKRYISFLVVFAMLLTAFAGFSMLTVSADPGVSEAGGYSITIIPDTFTDLSHEDRFEAYQIFKGKLTVSAEPGSKEERELADITWGDGVDGDALLKALIAEADVEGSVIGDAFKDIKTESNPDAAAQVADVLDGKEYDSEFVVAFSRIAAKHIKSGETEDKGISSTLQGKDTANPKFVITVEEPGYYLVVDNYGASSEGDARSAYILDVLGKQEIYIKADAPTVDKVITNPRDEEGKNKGSSFDIGDTVSFRLTGTIPENYDTFIRYYYKFTDTLSEGLTYTDGSLKVYIYNWTFDDDGNKVGEPEITVLDEDTDYTLKVEGQVITVEITDLKKISKTVETEGVEETKTVKVLSTSEIVVEYDAVLNEKAVIGTGSDGFGNINKVKLTYSNDPNDDGEGEPPTNDTPEKKVYVFTFSLDILKIASDKEFPDNALKGAGFTLTRNVASDDGKTAVQYAYFRKVTEEAEDGSSVEKIVFQGWAESKDAKTDVDGKTIPEDAIFELMTDEFGKFKIFGLGSGSYVLKETTTPDGYNTMKDIIFEIIPTYSEEEGHEGELVKLEVKVDGERNEIDVQTGEITVTEGNIPMTLVNDRAPMLPGTGGSGVKWFYIAGGILMAGALAFIMISSRKKSENN